MDLIYYPCRIIDFNLLPHFVVVVLYLELADKLNIYSGGQSQSAVLKEMILYFADGLKKNHQSPNNRHNDQRAGNRGGAEIFCPSGEFMVFGADAINDGFDGAVE